MSKPTRKNPPLTLDHELQIGESLNLLEEAQALCLKAFGVLADVPGFGPECLEVSYPYQALEAAKRRVTLRRKRLLAAGKKAAPLDPDDGDPGRFPPLDFDNQN